MARLSDAKFNVLALIATQSVYVFNNGKTDTKGISAQTLRSLRKEGYVTANGAVRKTIKGRSARKLVLTLKGYNIPND